MHDIRLHEFGPAENLRDEEVVDPQPGPGAVREALGDAEVTVALETRATMGEAVLVP
jgi:NADPH:quinone reductase